MHIVWWEGAAGCLVHPFRTESLPLEADLLKVVGASRVNRFCSGLVPGWCACADEDRFVSSSCCGPS
jgi:hypothetical protein